MAILMSQCKEIWRQYVDEGTIVKPGAGGRTTVWSAGWWCKYIRKIGEWRQSMNKAMGQECGSQCTATSLLWACHPLLWTWPIPLFSETWPSHYYVCWGHTVEKEGLGQGVVPVHSRAKLHIATGSGPSLYMCGLNVKKADWPRQLSTRGETAGDLLLRYCAHASSIWLNCWTGAKIWTWMGCYRV